MQVTISFQSMALASFLFALLALTYSIVSPFLVPTGWAIILAFVTWPLYAKLNRVIRDKPALSAFIMSMLLTGLIFVPLILIVSVLREESIELLREWLPRWLAQKPQLPLALADKFPIIAQELQNFVDNLADNRVISKEKLISWLQRYSSQLFAIAEDAGSIVTNLGITILISFFFYRDGHEIARQIRIGMLSVFGERFDRYINNAKDAITGVVYGIVLAAFSQATIAGIGYYAAGLHAPILLAALTMFFAFIPFGAPLVWLPLSLYLMMTGQYWAGIGLAIWGLLVISWIDNIVRPLVITQSAKIPFLLVLFGVFGGLLSFGLIGLFIGPITLSIMLSVWREWVQCKNRVHQ